MIGTEDARSGALLFVAPMVKAFFGRSRDEYSCIMAVHKNSKGPYKRVLFFLEILQISRKFPRSDKNKNTRFLNAIRQILKSNFPRFKRSSAMLKIIL